MGRDGDDAQCRGKERKKKKEKKKEEKKGKSVFQPTRQMRPMPDPSHLFYDFSKNDLMLAFAKKEVPIVDASIWNSIQANAAYVAVTWTSSNKRGLSVMRFWENDIFSQADHTTY